MKANFRTIRTQVSQTASAGNAADMSEQQAQNCMDQTSETGSCAA